MSILPTLLIQFVWGRLGELGSISKGQRKEELHGLGILYLFFFFFFFLGGGGGGGGGGPDHGLLVPLDLCCLQPFNFLRCWQS